MMLSPEIGEALRRCRAALRVAIGIMTADGTLIDVDDTMCELLGRTRDDVLGLAKNSLVVTGDRALANARSRERRTSLDAQPPVELTVVRGDGTHLKIESVTAPLPDGRWVFTWRDVSMPSEIRLVAEQLRDLVEQMPLGVVIWDAAGVEDPMEIRLRWANPAGGKALGKNFRQHYGQTVTDVFPQAPRYDDAARALLLRGTDRIEHFPDVLVGDRRAPSRVYTRDAIALPGDAIAFLMRDVTNERAEELRRRRLLERIVDTSDAERRALAMGVHDDSVQQIAAATMLVEALRRTPPASGDDDRLVMMEAAMRAAMASLRRLVFELSPPELVESGIEGALRSAADYLFVDTPTEVSIDVLLDPDDPLDTPVETAGFRIAAEALTNVRKHAQAAHVDVRVSELAGSIDLVVIDDGVGFDRAERPGHIGLRSMIERAASVGGTCTVDSRPWGTVVHAVLPRAGRYDDAVPAIDWLQIAEVSSRTEIDSVRLENASLREASRVTMERATDARRRLSGVVSLWQALGETGRSTDELLHSAALHIADTLHDGCWIRMLADQGRRLTLAASWHPVPEQKAYLDQYLYDDKGIEASDGTTTIITTGRPVMYDRGRAPWSFRNDPVDPPPLDPRYALVVPLAVGTEVIGTVSVVRDRTAQTFAPDDEALLQMMADTLGLRLAPLLENLSDAPPP